VTSDAHFLVAEAEGSGAIVGYVVALEAADEGEILNLAVAPAGRRSGLGRALVERILEALTANGAGALRRPRLQGGGSPEAVLPAAGRGRHRAAT